MTVSPPNTALHASDAADEPAGRVLRQFRLVFNAVKTHFQQVQKSAGLGGAQLWALSLIASSEGLGVNDLARSMDIHQSTASNIVRALAARHLIDVKRTEADRRSVRLSLRPEGRLLLQMAPSPFSGVLPQALARLSEPTLARLEDDLAELIALIDTNERDANLPLGL
ncbi:MarR family winged helix-turn-helix transcriptional regulator [Sphaerotilus microaerophilus]|jgi:DNA-binding MarR family transcriptional regulator|nr:MarR family transcriptional regulator [Sphaerotilus sp. FB-5]